MKIVIFNVEPWERQTFDRLSGEHEIEYVDYPLTANNASQYGGAEIISTFIYSDLHTPVLEQLPNLRLIATRSTGFDHIDSDYCQEHDIKVCNVPTYGENTVAEHIFGLLLAISHRLIEATERTRKGIFLFKDYRDSICGVKLWELSVRVILVCALSKLPMAFG